MLKSDESHEKNKVGKEVNDRVEIQYLYDISGPSCLRSICSSFFFFVVVVKSGEPQGKWKLVYRLIGLRSFEAVLFKLLDHFRKTTKI